MIPQGHASNVIFCLLLAVALGYSPPLGQAATLELTYQFREGLKGYKAQAKGAIDSAIAYLSKDVDQHPQNVESRLALAHLVWIDHPAEARRQLEQLLTKFPRVAEVHAALGEMDFYEQRIDAAQDHFARAIEIDPRNAFPYNALAYLQAKAGESEKAFATLQQGIQNLGPRVAFFFNQAVLYAVLNHDTQAKTHLEQAIALDPQDVDSYFLLGTVQLRQRDFPAARRALEQVVAMMPDHALAWLGLAMTYDGEGHYAKAIALGEHAQRLEPFNLLIAETLAKYRAAARLRQASPDS